MVGAIFLLIVLTRVVQFRAEELNVDIKLLEPRGISISIPGDTGIEAFYFWATINEKSSIRLSAVQPNGGRWVIRNEDLELASGDEINYVVLVQKGGEFKRYDSRSFVVPGSKQSEVYDSGTTSSTTPLATASTQIPTTPLRTSKTTPNTIKSTATSTATTTKLMAVETKSTTGFVDRRSTSTASPRTIKTTVSTTTPLVTTSTAAPVEVKAEVAGSAIVPTLPTVAPRTSTATEEPRPKSGGCATKIMLQSDDFGLDFYGDIDINGINPKMLASLVVHDCEIKHVAVEEEPNVVEFHIS